MMKAVQKLDYNARYAVAPPAVPATIDTDSVVVAHPIRALAPGPHVFVVLEDGSTYTIRGTVAELMGEGKEGTAHG